MGGRRRIFIIMVCMSAVLDTVCFADTFKNRSSGEELHGYIIEHTSSGKTIVQTTEKARQELSLSAWDVTANRLGRSNKVCILILDSVILLEMQTRAFEETLADLAGRGPLFILLEIDTPGGITDLAKRMCQAINKTDCPVVAFIKGGQYGGAISAGIAVSFACDKIYMTDGTSIGAATLVGLNKKGAIEDLDKLVGTDIGEKLSSAWQAYCASLAEKNGRPPLLAKAMIEKDIEVVEIKSQTQNLFIAPSDKKESYSFVRTWSQKGSLLTLTAAEAVKCGIADKIIGSREELLKDMDAADSKVVVDNRLQKATMEYQRAEAYAKQLRKRLDLNIKQFHTTRQRPRALQLLRKIRDDFKAMITLAKRYPDLKLNVIKLENELNSVEATFRQVKINSRRR
ncbi:MAG: hypothetical protein ACYSSI_07540 [Planctomycetota bacterium]